MVGGEHSPPSQSKMKQSTLSTSALCSAGPALETVQRDAGLSRNKVTRHRGRHLALPCRNGVGREQGGANSRRGDERRSLGGQQGSQSNAEWMRCLGRRCLGCKVGRQEGRQSETRPTHELAAVPCLPRASPRAVEQRGQRYEGQRGRSDGGSGASRGERRVCCARR